MKNVKSSKDTLKDLSKEQARTSVKSSLKNEPAALPLPLSEKERAVLSFIESYQTETGSSPSYQEIKDHFGFASFNSVQNYLKQLTQKAYIATPSNQKRAIQILQSSNALQNSLKESPRRPLLHTPSEREETLSLPLLGKVAAGLPIEALTHDEHIQVPPSLVRNATKSYALQVSGQSMIEDGIFDGDVILVQKQNFASNGEIVVARIENEATVKRFYKRSSKDVEDDRSIELRPANSQMQSMWYHPAEVDIQGIVVGLIRKF